MHFHTIIHADELHSHLSHPNLAIIDCRFSLADTESGRRDFQAGHIPGAQYAHLDDDLSGTIIPGTTGRHPLPAPEDFAKVLSKWGIDNETQVIAYDQGHGGIAARLWWMLRWLGHDKVAVLNGGWAEWSQKGLTVGREFTAATPKSFVPNERMEWIASVEEVRQNAQDSTHRLVDARAAARYRGEQEPIDPVAGHIPGAHSLPFAENLNESGLWRSPEELRNRFTPLLANADRVTVYCGSGVTACHNLLALEMAGLTDPMPKLYPGSWSHWITDANREIALGDFAT
ncbi:MAG: sulfurtransferase [Bacteroidota bacterium]